MKILDRYIAVSVAAAFASGVTMFMVLLCAMNMLKELIELIAKEGVPAGLAFTIIGYKIPGLMVYAFPMAVLLAILLTFSRMSSECEMVAIRAAGVSFVRIIIPTLLFALLVSGLTFWISNSYAPYASKKSRQLSIIAISKKNGSNPVSYTRVDKKTGKLQYAIAARNLDVNGQAGVMYDVTVTYYQEGVPNRIVFTPIAEYMLPREKGQRGHWVSHGSGGYSTPLGGMPQGIPTPGVYVESSSNNSLLSADALADIPENPLTLKYEKTDPNELTSDEIRAQLAELQTNGDPKDESAKWLTRLAQRFATPFTCLVFALIGAPLGLRHHRTSSAVGLGISLLVIFAYYFFSVYLSTFGDSKSIPPLVAAWTPNVLGGILGIWLIVRANR